MIDVFRAANGGWVDGMRFEEMRMTQFHAVMFKLERRGFVFDRRLKAGCNWKEYRLVSEPLPLPPARLEVAPILPTGNAQVAGSLFPDGV